MQSLDTHGTHTLMWMNSYIFYLRNESTVYQTEKKNTHQSLPLATLNCGNYVMTVYSIVISLTEDCCIYQYVFILLCCVRYRTPAI